MTGLFTSENAFALLTLTSLEIVPGIDDIVFFKVITGKLDQKARDKARNLGLRERL